ncbi:hypothetical protein ACET3Z_016957 [Daucus carota]
MAGNAVWHICSVLKIDSQELLLQKGCVIWNGLTGLSGSGKSTLARGLHMRRKLIFILDCNNVRHGLNKDLTFKAEDHVHYYPKYTSFMSFRKDCDACHALLQGDSLSSVYMRHCFTCIDDPYEPPLKSQGSCCSRSAHLNISDSWCIVTAYRNNVYG